jgi:hypothetical protein
VFLSARYTIPVPKATHAVWHDVLMPTEEKYCAWLSRVQGRFEQKVADTIARGKAPNLRNYGSMYRDAEPEIVWRLSCWWVWLLPYMKGNHSAARVSELTAMFYTGALDKDMYDKVKYLDPAASPDQVRFVRTEDVKGLEEKESTANDDVESAELAEKEAVFNTFKSKLGREQATFQFYGERKREYEAVTQGLLTEARRAMPVAVSRVKSTATTPAPATYKLWPKRKSTNPRFKTNLSAHCIGEAGGRVGNGQRRRLPMFRTCGPDAVFGCRLGSGPSTSLVITSGFPKIMRNRLGVTGPPAFDDTLGEALAACRRDRPRPERRCTTQS